MERTKAAAGEDFVDFDVDGRTVRVLSRPADDEDSGRLFELSPSPTWSDASPLTDDDVAVVVRRMLANSTRQGQALRVIGVSPGAAMLFPNDSRISVVPVEPLSFSLPGMPTGLILKMDDRGDGHLWALGEQRVELGSDGMWWIVTRLIEALEAPEVANWWPRFLTVGGTLGGPATQASLELGESSMRVVWSRLESGLVGDVIAVQELSHERATGWLSLLRPVRDRIEQDRVHHQRLRPARTAEKWARALERWSH